MSDRKFLGFCILLASIILSGAIFWHGNNVSQSGRYQFQVNQDENFFWVIDTTTGEIFVKRKVKTQDDF